MLSKTAKPVILILSGPSGAGKTTLSHALITSIPDTLIAVSHTTRSPRTGEKEGKDYFFVNKQTFLDMIDSGAMLEYAEVYGNLYGTSRTTIEKALRDRKNLILDIDWQGARRIKAIYPDAVSVFILPPDGKEAKNRLLSRQQDTEKTIQKRMSSYGEQISHQDEYDHVLINADIDSATRQLINMLST
ncbi:MAG: guanylate kinase [Arenicellales bacterium]